MSRARRITVRGLLLLIGLVFAGPLPTSAQDALPPEAQAAMQRGLAAAKQQEWQLAIKYFGEAREAAPYAPEALFNLALAHDRLGGRELLAIAWFRAYLAAAPGAANAGQVRERIFELEVKVEANAAKLIRTAKEAAARLPDESDRKYQTARIAAAQARTGDIAGAQIKAGDRAGAEATLELATEAPRECEVRSWTVLASEELDEPLFQDIQGFIRSPTDKEAEKMVGALADAAVKLAEAMRNLQQKDAEWREQQFGVVLPQRPPAPSSNVQPDRMPPKLRTERLFRALLVWELGRRNYEWLKKGTAAQRELVKQFRTYEDYVNVHSSANDFIANELIRRGGGRSDGRGILTVGQRGNRVVYKVQLRGVEVIVDLPPGHEAAKNRLGIYLPEIKRIADIIIDDRSPMDETVKCNMEEIFLSLGL